MLELLVLSDLRRKMDMLFSVPKLSYANNEGTILAENQIHFLGLMKIESLKTKMLQAFCLKGKKKKGPGPFYRYGPTRAFGGVIN